MNQEATRLDGYVQTLLGIAGRPFIQGNPGQIASADGKAMAQAAHRFMQGVDEYVDEHPELQTETAGADDEPGPGDNIE